MPVRVGFTPTSRTHTPPPPGTAAAAAKNAADDRSPGMLSAAAESRASPAIVTVVPSRRGVTPKAVNIRSV